MGSLKQEEGPRAEFKKLILKDIELSRQLGLMRDSSKALLNRVEEEVSDYNFEEESKGNHNRSGTQRYRQTDIEDIQLLNDSQQ